jgi:glycosyltransferase involved in cell wall biosynthesis
MLARLSDVGSSRDKITCDVLLPCLDEADALPWILGRMPPGFQPIVIDNGSQDGSPQLATDLGAIVVNAERRGYGSACHAGLVAATAPLVAVMDADASLDPAQLPDLIAPLVRDHADLVVGIRRLAHRRAQPWTLRLANAELARRVRRRTGLPLRDIGPMRAARREALLELDVQDRRSGYPVETVVRAADAGWRIVAVDTEYLVRRGRSKVTGTPLGAWRAVRDISAVLALPSSR